jgi:hypothetical protein
MAPYPAAVVQLNVQVTGLVVALKSSAPSTLLTLPYPFPDVPPASRMVQGDATVIDAVVAVPLISHTEDTSVFVTVGVIFPALPVLTADDVAVAFAWSTGVVGHPVVEWYSNTAPRWE